MTDVVRWGRSAYETDDALAEERRGAQDLGLSLALRPELEDPGPLEGTRAMVVTSKVRVDGRILDRFGGELVLTTTSGFDHIDVEACMRRGVRVARCPLARLSLTSPVEYALTFATLA